MNPQMCHELASGQDSPSTGRKHYDILPVVVNRRIVHRQDIIVRKKTLFECTLRGLKEAAEEYRIKQGFRVY